MISQAIGRISRLTLGLSLRLWETFSLIVLLSVTATIPILQLASLGYMLEASGRLARGLPLRSCFPGAATAGRMVTSAVWLGLTWLPVWFVADLAYSAELIDPGSASAARWRFGARTVSVIWVLWSAWALFRGGRWYHFIWPAPKTLLRTVLKREAWHALEDRLWAWAGGLRVPHLMKIGLYGTLGAILWLIVPSTLIVIALNGSANNNATPAENGLLAVVGLIGAFWMWYVLQYLPFLQVHMGAEGRLRAILDRRAIQSAFRHAPAAYGLAAIAFFAMAIPLYLLRIESIPPQLWWMLSILFVVFMFPAKLLVGWALRCSRLRPQPSHWLWRWMAWVTMFAGVGLYVGVLYIAKFALWEGAASVLLQHAFLPPVPFYLR